MTASSARKSSVSEFPWELGGSQVDVWLCPRNDVDSKTLVLGLLSGYSGLKAAELKFERGEHGKPGLVNAPFPLHFSLSHSGDWLGCAITRDAPLGLDLERHDPQRDVVPLARRFFSDEEYRALCALDEPARRGRFHDLWTLKEAHVKARGGSLGLELERVHFHIDHTASGTAVITPAFPSHYVFYGQLALLQGYSLSLCLLPGAGRQPRVRAFQRQGFQIEELTAPWVAVSLLPGPGC